MIGSADELTLDVLSSQQPVHLEIVQDPLTNESGLLASQEIQPMFKVQEYSGQLVTATFKKRFHDSSTLDFFEVISGKKFIHGADTALRFVRTCVWETKANSVFLKRGQRVFLVSTKTIRQGDEVLAHPIKPSALTREVRKYFLRSLFCSLSEKICPTAVGWHSRRQSRCSGDLGSESSYQDRRIGATIGRFNQKRSGFNFAYILLI